MPPLRVKRRLTTSKVQRWIDLLAALLARRFPATFETLARDVPAYANARVRASVLRTFERDKDELRSLGIPIETVTFDDGEATGYRLDNTKFYLPYLSLVGTPFGAARRRRIGRYGYHHLQSLEFEPDQLAVIAQAAARVHELGHPLLVSDAESAIRKLALDLPIGGRAGDDVRVITKTAATSAEVFDTLSDALSRRKLVTFDYHAISHDRTEQRTVEPYGLFFLGANWYLAARDRDRGEMRNFRLSRISGARVNSKRAQTPDYEIQADFDLRAHARSRQAWELGEGDALEAVVEFSAMTGATAAASRLGQPVEGHSGQRAFRIKRVDAFARWLLSFGGDALPVSPPQVVAAFRELIDSTGALYADAAGAPVANAGGGSAADADGGSASGREEARR